MSKTWFITGANRGLGAEIAKAALRAGDRVIATARNGATIADISGSDSENLLTLNLDVTDRAQADAAVVAATSMFGTIDVLVNNAGYGHLGFFEEMSMDDVRAQMDTNLFGVFNVTWAVLPVMRAARAGKIFNISSLGGFMGGELSSLYCASKFALEGFSDSLAKEISPFGIRTTVVEPGPFRTDFLSQNSLRFNGTPIADYDDRRSQLRDAFSSRDGQQPGDPAKLAEALVQLADLTDPPSRFVAGSIATNAVSAKLEAMRALLDEWRSLSVGTDYSSSNAA
jgi:NAD(P)-dependent dehydrogenase (short-subunit alcohol dehydrogenase family)